MPCPLPPHDRRVTPLQGKGGPTWLLGQHPASPLPSRVSGHPRPRGLGWPRDRGLAFAPPPTPQRGRPGTAAVSPHPCVCLSTLFRSHAKGQPSSPNTRFGSPRGRVCVSVTVVQNKFYLSLLYPELDLALREPCADRPQADLSGTKLEGEACSPPPPRPVRAAGSGGTSKATPRAP